MEYLLLIILCIASFAFGWFTSVFHFKEDIAKEYNDLILLNRAASKNIANVLRELDKLGEKK